MGFRSRSESARQGQARENTGRRVGQHSNTASGNKNTHRGRQSASQRSTGYQQRRPTERQKKFRAHGSGDKARDVALAVLREVTENDAFANLVLPTHIKQAGLKGRDAAFCTEITYGCLRATGLIDAIISKAAGRPVEKIDSMVLDILRLGAYQILRTRVDDHAAVNTSVELAKAHGAGQASGFVNGVLRTITRSTPQQWAETVAGGDNMADIALRNAHPAWIARAFNDSLSYASRAETTNQAGDDGATPAGGDVIHDELSACLAADDARPIVHLAARPGQISAEELALVTGGEEGKLSPYCVYLEDGSPGDLDAVREGMASVQDEGSQLIALSLVNTPLHREDSGRWLDLCAGPGGKTAFIASWALGENARVDAVELAEHRARLVENTTRNLPVSVHVGDGRAPRSIPGLDVPAEGYDRVLVDAPCSGLGALRRRPEARWRKTAADVAPLSALQKELLRSAVDITAQGGIVIYSTCSPHLSETVDVVRSISAQTGAEIVDLSTNFPHLKHNDAAPFIQLWPHRHGTDAMFIAGLRPARHSSVSR
ncbi:rRNA small subunit methyltransferase B [Corynebacterium sp. 4HC-13]|uniref:RsmB/NOP family class I SAM-dependent RNA methyltransferase n=1 Tax=Corynebacterium anserum TaxID=2684406 RepID=UPI00163B35D7|nr:transcription antitermination factor NusB [Corynebacterium anserum]MBC2681611.1 rRNA small subunit methyltransferase B [Corynebacterium anserum]